MSVADTLGLELLSVLVGFALALVLVGTCLSCRYYLRCCRECCCPHRVAHPPPADSVPRTARSQTESQLAGSSVVPTVYAFPTPVASTPGLYTAHPADLSDPYYNTNTGTDPAFHHHTYSINYTLPDTSTAEPVVGELEPPSLPYYTEEELETWQQQQAHVAAQPEPQPYEP